MMLNSQRAYENKDYWLQLIEKDAQIWESGFLNTNLDENALFVYTVFIDYEKGFIRNRWAHYPNIESLQGFITNVFMPSAIFQLLDSHEESFMTPLASSDEVQEYMAQLDGINSIEIDKTKDLLFLYDEIVTHNMQETTALKRLQLFSDIFNKQCSGENKLVYFNLFQSPTEIRDFVRSRSDEEIEGLLEEELGMSLDSWDDMCENVYTNPFFNKRFSTILNSKLSCLI